MASVAEAFRESPPLPPPSATPVDTLQLQATGLQEAAQVPQEVPQCATPGCSRETWNGRPGQTCCRTCSVSLGNSHGPDCDRKFKSKADEQAIVAPSPAASAVRATPAVTEAPTVVAPAPPPSAVDASPHSPAVIEAPAVGAPAPPPSKVIVPPPPAVVEAPAVATTSPDLSSPDVPTPSLLPFPAFASVGESDPPTTTLPVLLGKTSMAATAEPKGSFKWRKHGTQCSISTLSSGASPNVTCLTEPPHTYVFRRDASRCWKSGDLVSTESLELAEGGRHVTFSMFKPSQDFKRSWVKSRLTGCLVLLIMVTLLSAPVALTCWLLSHWTEAWYYGLVLIPVGYLRYFLKGYLWWSRDFRHLPTQDDPANPTHAALPREIASRQSYEVKLSMQPTRISFLSFMWCMHFIWPFFIAYTVCQLVRRSLFTRYVRRHPAFEREPAERALGRLMLETTAAFWFKKMLVRESRDKQQLALFSSAYFGPLELPAVGGGFVTAQAAEIIVDLESGCAVSATWDGEELSLEHAFLCGCHAMAWKGHAWWHCFAMWNASTNLRHTNPWIRRFALISIFTNYLGGSGGGNKLTSKLKPETPITADNIAFQKNMMPIDSVAPLVPYSRFIAFLQRAYSIHNSLLAEPEFLGAFPNVENDAVFVDTVLHSLDHWILHHLFDAPGTRALWVVEKSGEKGSVDWHTIGSLTTLAYSISDDHPRLHSTHIRESPFPFHRKFYEEVSAIDPELAWYMQACMAQ